MSISGKRLLTNLLLLSGFVFHLQGIDIQVSQDYVWDNIPVGGGGYVTGIVIHPLNKDIVYIRTDVGGAYSWDKEEKKWIQMLNWVGPGNANLIGVDGVALDPNNQDRVYLALGKSIDGTGGIYRSEDRGQTWTILMSAAYEGNGRASRWIGECIAVDPHSSGVIYAGTRTNGLHRSTNDGVSWSKVTSVPNGFTGTNPTGVRSIVFDPSTTLNGKSSTIYVGVPASGVYKSIDGGATFSIMAGSPLNPARMQVVNQELFVTHGTGVTVYNGESWVNITPAAGVGKNFVALAVDPTDSSKIVVAERYGAFYNKIYKTSNKGASWIHINSSSGAYNRFVTIPWWSQTRFSSATSAMAMAPGNSGELYYTDWFGVWYTPDVWASKTDWHTLVAGHEETVVLTVVSPPSGALVYSGMADNFGFRHDAVNEYPKKTLYLINEGFSIAFCEQQPSNIAILGAKSWGGDETRLATSSDSGETWTNRTLPASTTLGKIAISSTDPDKMIYVAGGGAAYYTTNRGSSWDLCQGAPGNAIRLTDIWNKDFALAADLVNGNKFYLFKSGLLYMTNNGGVNWSVQNTSAIPNFSGYLNVVAMPGKEGEIWISLDKNGLWKTSNGGKNFTQISYFSTASLFTFGAPEPGSNIPTAYCYGIAGGNWGLYRSTNLGVNWVQINDEQHQFPSGVKALAGDRRTFGRIFIGSGGCGVFYGELKTSSNISDAVLPKSETLINVYPNPSKGLFEVHITDEMQNAGYHIFNSLGSLISTGFLHQKSSILDIRDAETGVYLLRITHKGQSYFFKLFNVALI
jgi:xyloglucan-specific exo-beta-1,4-glucanase